MIAIPLSDGRVRLWRLGETEFTDSEPLPDSPTFGKCMFSSEGDCLVLGSFHGQAWYWRYDVESAPRPLPIPSESGSKSSIVPVDVRPDPDGTLFQEETGRIVLFDRRADRATTALVVPDIRQTVRSSGGRLIAVASGRNTLTMFEIVR